VAQGQIPRRFLTEFQEVLRAILRSKYLPVDWSDAQFFVPYPVKPTMAVRGGVSTIMGNTADLGAGNSALENGDPVQTAWTNGEIELLPLGLYEREGPLRSLYLRVRLRGKECLQLGSRPEDFTRSAKDFGAFFAPDAFHALLTKLLRVPFESPDDFLVSGFDTGYDGVRVYHGELVSREYWRRRLDDKLATPAHWWDDMRLLVTDSDPQYFCLQIHLGEKDILELP